MNHEHMCLDSMLHFANLKIDMLETTFKENEKVIDVATNMLKIQVLIPFIITLIAFITGGISNISNFMNAALVSSVYGFVASLPVVLISSLYWGISKIYVSKKNNEINVDITATLEIKKMIEEEIEKLNERKIDSSNHQNIIISVRERQKEIEDKAKENYNNKNKIKKLTLRKRK